MTEAEVDGMADALGLDSDALDYRLNGHGDPLYPPLTPWCWYCHDQRHGQQGSACPVRYSTQDRP